jgi:16S rRNA processing protein RimM
MNLNNQMTDKNRKLCAAIIVGAHGIRGQVKVKSFLEDPGELNAFGALMNESGSENFELLVEGSAKGNLICKIKGIEDRNRAEAVKGLRLFIDRDQLPKIDEENAFYAEDLVGMKVISPTGTNVGLVKAVFDFGAGDILEIALLATDKSELFPFTKDIFPVVNPDQGILTFVNPTVIVSQDEDGNVH